MNDKKEFIFKKNNFFYYNELSISYLIKEIKNYTLFFLPINKSNIININIEKKTIIDNLKDDYVIVEYNKFKKNSFLEYFIQYKITNIHMCLLMKIIETYKLLIEYINLLLVNGIIHFNLNKNNIIFNNEINNFMLCNFNYSIPINNIRSNNDYLKNYINLSKINNGNIFLEVYIINYIIHIRKNKQNNFLKMKDLNNIYLNYITNNKEIFCFIKDERKYKDDCKNKLKNLLNIPIIDILNNLKKSYLYWDIFDINILFLKLIKKLNLSIENSQLLNLFSQLLKKNLSLNNNLWLSCDQILSYINKILIYQGNNISM